ncbi:MAG: IscS subfamily cysteine desulfurase [Betaproteobacteria bacterium RIFCSPLOWO2_12_FULL_62_13]|nr:MAG: IscS subfamily cysteine desulfurase [Betaproteobacteria bacterium RIFCSPLOWO2_12_FULL_62_13]
MSDVTLKLPIYLDNAATTPIDPRVVEKMLPYLTEQFGNPASTTHVFGQTASRAVEEARDQVAALINADPREIVWTSGATESDNLAIKGAAYANQARGRHLVTLQTEHKAVLDTVQELERRGFTATYLAPEPNGLLDLDRFRAALRSDTIVSSVMLVNNEIGVIQDIAAIGAVCRERGIVFHVDAAQASGKVAIDLARLPVDLMSLTAHKTYGPKGIGALYVRREPHLRVEAQMHGGGHERGLRSGTLATHQIAGMGECFRIAREEMESEVPRMRRLRDKLLAGLADLPEVRVNGDMNQRIANNLHISLNLENCDFLLAALTDIAVSSTAACSSGSAMPSHVVQALGADAATAGNSVRITVGRFNTEHEIDYTIAYLRRKIEDCRAGRLRAE